MEPTTPTHDDWYTLDEASKILKCSVDTLRRGIKDKQVPHKRVRNGIRIPGWWVHNASDSASV